MFPAELATGLCSLNPQVDRLVQSVAAQRGRHNNTVDETVQLVDAWLVRNRRKG